MGAAPSSRQEAKHEPLPSEAAEADLLEEPGRGTHRLQLWAPKLHFVLITSWLLLALWVFGLPWWATILNGLYWDTVTEQAPQGLCSIPPEDLKCTDGQDFAQLAAAAGRTAGCGCGQGILGESLCPLAYKGGFQVSSYIDTAFGTGTMLALTAVPVASMWWAHSVMVEQLAPLQPAVESTMWWMLVVFQLFFYLFLILPVCLWKLLHIIFTVAFSVIFLSYWVLVGYLSSQRRRQVQICKITCVMSATSIVGGVGGLACVVLYHFGIIRWPYGFWLGQCIGIVAGLGHGPVVLVFGRVSRESRFRAG